MSLDTETFGLLKASVHVGLGSAPFGHASSTTDSGAQVCEKVARSPSIASSGPNPSIQL